MENYNNCMCEICALLSSFKISNIYKNFFFHRPISCSCFSNELGVCSRLSAITSRRFRKKQMWRVSNRYCNISFGGQTTVEPLEYTATSLPAALLEMKIRLSRYGALYRWVSSS
jgi:hypothetical protein